MHSLEPSSHQKRRKPCFFKFFFPSITDKQLEVPKAFLKHFDGDYCGTVSLKGPTGKIWHVNLTEKSNGVFLISGWQTFVKDHAIQVGSCLVFRYYGNFQFKVTILDTSACEKMDSPPVSDPIDHENNEEENIGEKKGNKFSKTYSFREACDGNIVCQHPGDGHSVLRPVCKKGEELGQQNWEKPFYKTRRSHSLNNFVEKSFKKYRVGVCHRRPYISQRRPVSNEEIKRAKKAAKSFTSRYPTTLMVMRKAYVYFGSGMALPRGFVRSSLPKVSLPMKLYDPNGKAWNIKYIYSDAYGSGSIGAGWSSFTFANNIEEHDVCVFEVISRNKMQVHIFRVVDEIAPLLKYSKRSKNFRGRKRPEGLQPRGKAASLQPKMAPARPHFFKIMMSDFSKQLPLPPAFLKYLPKEGSQRALLVGPSRGLWKIKLCRSGMDLYMQDGWEEFVKDHSLQEHDFLLFRYDGGMHFTVQIFDKTACEREDAFIVKANEQCKISDERKKRAKMVNSVPVSSDLTQQKLQRTPAMERKKGCDSLQGADVYSCKSGSNVKDNEEVDDGEEDDGEVSEDQNSFTSEKPFFVRKMTASHVNINMVVELPLTFRRSHLPPSNTVIVLQDLKGRSWKVRYIRSKPSILSAGWLAFSRDNNLKVGDICIFELVGKLKLQVHIFRGKEVLATSKGKVTFVKH